MRERLSGVVTVDEGRPARLATVELSNSSGDVVDQVAVDDSGRFIYYIMAGKWSLNAWDPFGHRCRQEVRVHRGENKNLELELTN